MPSFRHALVAIALAVLPCHVVVAEPTPVTVRVIAADAKFIGTAMGGVRVTLKDAASGTTLAQGVTTGGTGDTDRIMKASGRNPARATPESAAFVATLDLARPTLVDLVAEGPLGFPGSSIRVASQRWVVPGHAVSDGDGWVVELPGLVISPRIARDGGKAVIAAKVELMCGCPITPGGLWDAADYEVRAILYRNGRRIGMTDLRFDTAPGGYAGQIALPDNAVGYTLGLLARNRRTGNSGYREEALAAE